MISVCLACEKKELALSGGNRRIDSWPLKCSCSSCSRFSGLLSSSRRTSQRFRSQLSSCHSKIVRSGKSQSRRWNCSEKLRPAKNSYQYALLLTPEKLADSFVQVAAAILGLCFPISEDNPSPHHKEPITQKSHGCPDCLDEFPREDDVVCGDPGSWCWIRLVYIVYVVPAYVDNHQHLCQEQHRVWQGEKWTLDYRDVRCSFPEREQMDLFAELQQSVDAVDDQKEIENDSCDYAKVLCVREIIGEAD